MTWSDEQIRGHGSHDQDPMRGDHHGHGESPPAVGSAHISLDRPGGGSLGRRGR